MNASAIASTCSTVRSVSSVRVLHAAGSGATYGIRLLQILSSVQGLETHLVLTICLHLTPPAAPERNTSTKWPIACSALFSPSSLEVGTGSTT